MTNNLRARTLQTIVAAPLIFGALVIGARHFLVSTTVYDWQMGNQNEETKLLDTEVLNVLRIGQQTVRIGYGDAHLGSEINLLKSRPNNSRLVHHSWSLAFALSPLEAESGLGCREGKLESRPVYKGTLDLYSIYESKLGKCIYYRYRDRSGRVAFVLIYGPFPFKEVM